MTTPAGARIAWVVGEFVPPELSGADRARLEGLHGERRERFLRGRAALAEALGGAVAGNAGVPLEVRPARCPDCGERHGGPELAGGRLRASIAHTVTGSIAAVAEVRVGVDAEDRTGRGAVGLPVALPAGEDDPLQHWTRVEAVLKADGRGLRIEPDRIEFSRLPGGFRAILPGGAAYLVHDLELSGERAAALATSLGG